MAIADESRSVRHVFVRDLMVNAQIGVHDHERNGAQRTRINIDLSVGEPERPGADRLSEVVCYETVVKGVQEIVGLGHVNLVETLAERIAQMCLQDRRVSTVRVRIEKLDAIPEASSVGIEIERSRKNT